MRLSDLAVGGDGRNRTLLSPFSAKTSRNQPSNSRFIFGPAVWMRGLIKPPPGHGIAYIDWSKQEFGIAAALSGDELMQAAYRSGDPYMGFAIQAGAAPMGATKDSHKDIREQFKACVLAVQYGMEAESLAFRISQPVICARDLLHLHRQTYSAFWKWSDAVVNTAMLHGHITTVFGWPIHVGQDANPRSLRNFPMQANGAEMLRLACCLATESGIHVCAPIHDAVLIMAPLDHMDADVAGMRNAMAEASRVVLGGFELNIDVTQVHYPERYSDPRGIPFWNQVIALLQNRRG
jgi:DNA polymerase I-like protein with 3'-5' exonuclease and polymerase domains